LKDKRKSYEAASNCANSLSLFVMNNPRKSWINWPIAWWSASWYWYRIRCHLSVQPPRLDQISNQKRRLKSVTRGSKLNATKMNAAQKNARAIWAQTI